MDDDIKKIQLATGCSLTDAHQAYIAANKNVTDAINLTKKKYYVGNGQELQNKTITIYLYRNGLLVGDRFYGFNTQDGKKLKQMLERGEFDRRAAGVDADYVDVELITVDADYKIAEDGRGITNESRGPRKPGVKMGEAVCCPEVLHLDDEGLTLKIKVGGEKRRVIAGEGTRIKQVKEYIEQYTGPGFEIYDDEKVVPDDDIVENYKNCILTFKK